MKHSAAFLTLVESVRSSVRELGIEDFRMRRGIPESAVLVDVREDREWLAGHAEGAVHLGKGVIERDIVARFPDPDSPLVLYCGGGYRSALAADTLQRMGYRRVWSLAGGMRRWRELGLPERVGSVAEFG